MKSAAVPLRELAVQAGILGRHSEAVDLWQRFLEIKPDNAEAYLNLGSAIFATGKVKKALKAAEKSSALNSKIKESYFNRSLYELHLGRAKAAQKRLHSLLQQTPKYQAAKFIHAAAICCSQGVKKGKKAFTTIRDNNLTKEMIKIAGEELAKTLSKAGRQGYADKVREATAEKDRRVKGEG